MKKLITLLTTIVLILNLTACRTASDTTVSKTFNCFDTSITITIYSYAGDSESEDIVNECFALCSHYEKLFSRTIEDSYISKINSNMGNPTEVDLVVASIINDSIKYSQRTKGAFDITVAPLSSLWNIGSGNEVIPDSNDIKQALTHVGYDKISVEGNTVTLSDPNAAIDLGAIAKGFVADKLKSFMVSEGVTSGIINLGGNVLTIGGKTSDDGFIIGIKRPFSTEADDYSATIEVTNKAVVTSGIYERYFEYKNKKYHHIFNTKTGYPVDNNLYSVTIISTNSEEADALSTGVFALGLKKGKKLINSTANVEAVFITDEEEIILTDGLEMNENNEITFAEDDSKDE